MSTRPDEFSIAAAWKWYVQMRRRGVRFYHTRHRRTGEMFFVIKADPDCPMSPAEIKKAENFARNYYMEISGFMWREHIAGVHVEQLDALESEVNTRIGDFRALLTYPGQKVACIECNQLAAAPGGWWCKATGRVLPRERVCSRSRDCEFFDGAYLTGESDIYPPPPTVHPDRPASPGEESPA